MLFSGACMISLTTKVADSNRLPSLLCSVAATVPEKAKQRIMPINSRMRAPFGSATRGSKELQIVGNAPTLCVRPHSLHFAAGTQFHAVARIRPRILDGERYSGLGVVSGHGLRVCVNPGLHLRRGRLQPDIFLKGGCRPNDRRYDKHPGVGFSHRL